MQEPESMQLPTVDGIRETAELKRAYWTPIVGADYPQRFAFPDVTVNDGQHLNIDGIELVVDDFGPTECSDNTAIELSQIDAVPDSIASIACCSLWMCTTASLPLAWAATTNAFNVARSMLGLPPCPLSPPYS